MTSAGPHNQRNTQIRVISHENHHQEQAIKIGEGKEEGSNECLRCGEGTDHVDRNRTFTAISAGS